MNDGLLAGCNGAGTVATDAPRALGVMDGVPKAAIPDNHHRGPWRAPSSLFAPVSATRPILDGAEVGDNVPPSAFLLGGVSTYKEGHDVGVRWEVVSRNALKEYSRILQVLIEIVGRPPNTSTSCGLDGCGVLIPVL